MQKVKIEDCNFLLTIFRNKFEETFKEMLQTGYMSRKGINFLSRDKETGYHLSFDVYFVFDTQDADDSKMDSFYHNLSDRQRKLMNDCLMSVVQKSKEYPWSTGQSSFMTVKPSTLEMDGIVGLVIFMAVSGFDEKASPVSHTFIEVGNGNNMLLQSISFD